MAWWGDRRDGFGERQQANADLPLGLDMAYCNNKSGPNIKKAPQKKLGPVRRKSQVAD